MSKIRSNENLEFNEVIEIIETTKSKIYKKVNEEFITMYFNIGKFLAKKIKNEEYGNSYINNLAIYIKELYPKLKGFNVGNLYKMKRFYELYSENKEALCLLTDINWSCQREIISRCKTMNERIYYMKLCIRDSLTRRELERQIKSSYYERYKFSNIPSTPAIERSKKATKNIFLQNYYFEFFEKLNDDVSEDELEKSIVDNMKDFILEIGKDFTFIKEEYPIKVGKHEFYIDLLFYHRGLQCLVAFELKVGDFKPEYISKMDFYLEALDRNVKKENENPSVGIILCAGKDDDVVEYSLSRTLSPTMVAEYNLKLIDKKLLVKKLKEYVEIAKNNSD